MSTEFPPLEIPPTKINSRPYTRSFICDPDCDLCLIPEINTFWRDQSLNGLVGTITGPTTKHARSGEILYFDGTNDRVVLPKSNHLILQNSFSIDAWIYPTKIDGTHHIYRRDGDVATYGFIIFRIESNNLKLELLDKNYSNACNGTAAITANKWHHVACTSDRTTAKLYIDGVMSKSFNDTTSDPLGTTGEFPYIGCDSTPTDFYKGFISELRVYQRVLDLHEIRSEWMRGAP